MQLCFFDVVGGSAELRISMCEPSGWCKGIGSVAVKQMFEVAATANVGTFWLNVHPDNAGAHIRKERVRAPGSRDL